MNRLKLSIIVPIYHISNAYIERCIDSILSQSLREFEVILVFDGKDVQNSQTRDFLSRRFRDERLKYIMYPSNHGVSYARNEGIKAASGQFVGFVDSDDYLDKFMYEKMMAQIEDADIVFCRLYAHYEDGERIVPWCELNLEKAIDTSTGIKYFHIGTIEDFSNEIKSEFTLGAVWRTVMRKEIIINNNIWFDTSVFWAEDSLFLNRLLLANNSSARTKLVDEYLYYYFQRSTSAMHNIAYRKNLVRSHSTYLSTLQTAMLESNSISQTDQMEILLTRKYKYWHWIVNNELLVGQGRNVNNFTDPLFRDVFIEPDFEAYLAKRSGMKTRLLFFLIKHKAYWIIKLGVRVRSKLHHMLKV